MPHRPCRSASVRALAGLILSLCTGFPAAYAAEALPPLAWPEIKTETRPWTRWWWPGSAVDAASITADLEAVRNAGIGGVEITPTYGARGHEAAYLDYLSPGWLAMLDHTLAEARRLGLGVDMATGTGWNFGGSTVGYADAGKNLTYRRFNVRGGERLAEPVRYEQRAWVRFVLNQVYSLHGSYVLQGEAEGRTTNEPELVPGLALPDVSSLIDPVTANPGLQALAIDQVKFARPLPLHTLMAYATDGRILELTTRVTADGMLDWTAPAGDWTLYAIFQGWTGKLVERAAPGAEGPMIDPLSTQAIRNFLTYLDRGLAGHDLSQIRAFFNDSYEYDDARFTSDWTDDFLAEFQRRRGYDLRNHLPDLLALDGGERHLRVLSDHRETINDLIRDRLTTEWAAWAHRKGKLVRNQAHGSPANVLDLYAASDIPETEGVGQLTHKLASSAAHVAGKNLVGNEAATFVNENFQSTPAQLKANLQRSFIGGVNHVVYHGMAFSPLNEPWPGWFFYVSIHLNPRNPIWEHTAAVHNYAARVQSFLQAGRPDPDVLLYYPMHDRYATPPYRVVEEPEGDGPSHILLEHVRVDEVAFLATGFGQLARQMMETGWAFDYVSDLMLQTVAAGDGRIRTPGADYRAIVLPPSRYIPVDTFARLIALAEAGATVIVPGELPGDVPGLHRLDERRATLAQLQSRLTFGAPGARGVQRASIGSGAFLQGPDLDSLMQAAGIRAEPLHAQGLQTIRRDLGDSIAYYILNPGTQDFEGWLPLARPVQSAVVLDATTGRSGWAHARDGGVQLQIEAGGSRLVRAYPQSRAAQPAPVYRAAGSPVALTGNWSLEFVQGGPTLPAARTVSPLRSWTETGGTDVTIFSGTGRYTLNFPTPASATSAGWWLDLGRVAESAKVTLNGHDLGTHVGPRFRIFVEPRQLQSSNRLEIEVANLAANRIADLDRRNVPWKKFYNNNIRALRAANRGADGMFTAAAWEPMESGLIGPVTLTPIEEISFPAQ